MRHIFGMFFLVAAVLVCEMPAWAQFDDFEVTLTPAAREYCHVLRFPQGWDTKHFDDRAPQHLFFGSPNSDYEFRVAGVLGTKILVSAFTDFVETKYYANNRYQVDFSDPTAAAAAVSRKTWDVAAVVPLTRKSAFPPIGTVPNDKRLDFHRFQFNRTGDFWGQPSDYATRLSPDQAWLVLQSTSPGKENGSIPVFFDFFNGDNGQRLFTIVGTFSSVNGGDPDSVFAKTGWVTERYFIVPLGRKIDRCLICDFGGRHVEKGAKQ